MKNVEALLEGRPSLDLEMPYPGTYRRIDGDWVAQSRLVEYLLLGPEDCRT